MKKSITSTNPPGAPQSLIDKFAGNPVRHDRSYNDGRPGYSVDETIREHGFKTPHGHDESMDDENEVYAELAEAGADTTAGDEGDNLNDDDVDEEEEGLDEADDTDVDEDREFSLSRQAFEPSVANLDDEDLDLENLPNSEPLKADREL